MAEAVGRPASCVPRAGGRRDPGGSRARGTAAATTARNPLGLRPPPTPAAPVLQTLKVIRYTTKLLLATALDGSRSELAVRLRRFESSIGTSR